MKITQSDLKTERQWRSATGLTKLQFEKLLEGFKASYKTIYLDSLNDRLVENGIGYCINNEAELLLYTLFSLKSGLTYDVLGIVTGMDASNAKRNQVTGVKVLQHTLAANGSLPKRHFLSVKDIEEFFADTKELLIDATEQVIQRPKDQEQRKDYYSGKKKHYC